MRLKAHLATGVCALALALAASATGDFAAKAETALDYHAVAPGKDIAPFSVPAAKEPHLNQQQLVAALRKKVKYVFVIYQENRSFDSYFATFPGVNGIYSRPADETPGFNQPIMNVDGSMGVVHPFRIGPAEFAADTDDIDHSHTLTVAKMNTKSGVPAMDHFSLVEETKYSPKGNPSLMAKQFGELAMAHEDCDTVPLLWRFADRFALFDNVFEQMTGPSTPGNLSIIAAQTGASQWAQHPDQATKGNGEHGMGVPVVNDADPYWGSQLDKSAEKMPVNPGDFKGTPAKEYDTQENLTFPTIQLSLKGKTLPKVTDEDTDKKGDLDDISEDIPFIAKAGHAPVAFGWYEEGYDHESTDKGPIDATGHHASYIAHHNGPQYFGYVANNKSMKKELHGLGDFFADVGNKALPNDGGVFFVKGGYQNTLGLKPADPDPKVQKNFIGDDDHPAYSDARISEIMVASAVNKIAASPYWKDSAIIITWDDSEGDYDHVRPNVRGRGPDGSIITNGPRVPLMVISPFSRTHQVVHAHGSQSSVVKFIDTVFDLPALAKLPAELKARELGKREFGLANMGPDDAITPDVSDLTSAFDPARLTGAAAPLPASYAQTPSAMLTTAIDENVASCKTIGIVPVDKVLNITNEIPADFNPRPKTNPTPVEPAAK
ncbi:MAG: hypothetical protein KGQ46_11195 [Hyphomicrobiales bacterium]|nr:hypothetical protein [Hyphomicrobiales bacterium]MDE2113312.1 hypothetical protein [Hyphomicrobiales bacterium]